MGADLAYMGTRFINTKESKAPKEYRDMIMEATADDIIYTAAISGVAANFLGPSIKAMGITEEMLSKKKKINFGDELTVHKDDAKAWATIWSAGQGVTNIHNAPTVADLVSKLKQDFISAVEKQSKYLEIYK